MSRPQSGGDVNSKWGKLGLAAGAVVCVPPLKLFSINLQNLPGYEQCVLTGVFVAALASCSLVASRWPVVGILVMPPCFFGLMSLACWWVVRR
jgi:hypothetical protein